MKKGNLKQEVVNILKSVADNVQNNTVDYDAQSIKTLLSEALMYYDLYIFKRDKNLIAAQELEKSITPRYEEGVRAKIREYLDEI